MNLSSEKLKAIELFILVFPVTCVVVGETLGESWAEGELRGLATSSLATSQLRAAKRESCLRFPERHRAATVFHMLNKTC